MELEQGDLLLIGEGIERAGREVGEGVVGWSEDGEAGVGVVELVVDLVSELRAAEEADECRVLASLLQNGRDVLGACRGRRCGCLSKSLGGEGN